MHVGKVRAPSSNNCLFQTGFPPFFPLEIDNCSDVSTVAGRGCVKRMLRKVSASYVQLVTFFISIMDGFIYEIEKASTWS